ncbi:MAG: hypothetical protein ACKVTZ_22530 [Bacteroidia bacterium]
MKRKCVIFAGVEQFKSENGIENAISIWVDEANQGEIFELLGIERNRKKFRRVLYEILNNRYNHDLYRKEDMSQSTLDVTAMKFSANNDRIYCREFPYEKEDKRVVMISVYRKKVQKNDKRIKNLLESVAQYEYEFVDVEEVVDEDDDTNL